MPTNTSSEVLAAAQSLQARGARNVLVTLGADGALLLRSDGTTIQQSALVPPGKVIDATGAGDAFRAAFAVALVEESTIEDALHFAAAAGAVREAHPILRTQRCECGACTFCMLAHFVSA